MKIRFRGHDYRQPKTWAEVKQNIAQLFGTQDVPRMITDTLDDEGLMAGALHPRDGRQGMRDCLARACGLAEEHPELGLVPQLDDRETSPHLPGSFWSEGNEARSRFFADHVASVARRRKDVVLLRKRLLGGKFLKADQVRALLSSLAVQMLSLETFTENGVPLLAHTSSEVNVDPAMAARTGCPTRIKIEWGTRQEGYVNFPEDWLSEESRKVPAIAEDGHLIHYPARRFSVLDEIGIVAEALTQGHPWGLADAVLFLLTNKPPQFRPVSVRSTARWTWDYHYGLITLAIEPWVTAQDVKAIYQSVQRQSFASPLKACTPDKLDVYRFVQRQVGRKRKRPPMTRLMKDWNRAHPERMYPTYRLFGKDYQRVERWVEDSILYPRYKMLGGVAKQPSPEPSKPNTHPAKPRANKREDTSSRARSVHAGLGRALKVSHRDES